MKIRLQLSQPCTEDHLMIGISSSLTDYEISYFLNKHFHTHFKKQPDITFYNKKGAIGSFPFYHFYSEDLRIDYYLFANKAKQSTAITHYKSFEFFILFRLSSYSIPINAILKEIRQISKIQAALQIPISTLKNLPEILEDIELHLLDVRSQYKKKEDNHWLWP